MPARDVEVRIQVNKKDILNGKKIDLRRCPVARAVRRKVIPGKVIEAESRYCTIYRGKSLGDPDYEVTFYFPQSVQNFIDEFDWSLGRAQFKPFSFVVHLPKDILRKKQKAKKAR